MSTLDIVRIPALRDNYLWLIRCRQTGTTGIVDPAEAPPVDAELQRRGWTLDWIVNTHHHMDHVGANLELKQRHGCRVVGPGPDRDRIPGIDVTVDEGDTWSLGDAQARVHFVPGHTRGHIAYHFADSQALFCGDTIFLMGCGRLFEGTPAQMWDSMRRLRALPDDTLVCCAHEYTLSNARFALTVDGDNPALVARAEQVRQAREQGQPTVPDRLGLEKATNPFMRVDDPALAAAVGMAGAPPEAVFGEIRARKDRF